MLPADADVRPILRILFRREYWPGLYSAGDQQFVPRNVLQVDWKGINLRPPEGCRNVGPIDFKDRNRRPIPNLVICSIALRELDIHLRGRVRRDRYEWLLMSFVALFLYPHCVNARRDTIKRVVSKSIGLCGEF